jgi:hypothetical protein
MIVPYLSSLNHGSVCVLGEGKMPLVRCKFMFKCAF